MNPDDLFIQRRLNGIIRQLNGIALNLKEFGDENPTVIAPNLIEAMVGNLKDDINILLREMNMIGSPEKKRLQERRFICHACGKFFMAPLVAGICDECRSRGITSGDLQREQEQESDGEKPADNEAADESEETAEAVKTEEAEEAVDSPPDEDPFAEKSD